MMNSYKNYIDLLRNIVKNFDDEFDYVIKKILIKIFNDYYMNRGKCIYCIDNLYKKFYVAKYNKIKKKYGIIKKDDLIFRFNRYNKKAYIIKLLKENLLVILDAGESYDSVVDKILEKTGIKNYKKYIDNMFINREIDRNIFIEVELDKNIKKVCKKEVDKKVFKKVDNDFKNWGYTNCLTCICYGNYCPNHDKI